MSSLVLFPPAVLCFVFLFFFFCIYTLITHCLWFLFQSFHSNFLTNLCLSFTSTNQEPLLYSSGYPFVHLSCQSQLPFLLPQSKILLSTLYKAYLCSSEFHSGRILLKPAAQKIDCSIKEKVSLFSLARIVSAPACSSPQLQLCWKSCWNIKNETCWNKQIYETQNCKTCKIVLSKDGRSFSGVSISPHF